MTNQLHVALALVVGLIGTGFVVPASAADKLENIPLTWKPTTDAPSRGAINLSGLENVRLQVDPLVDRREDPSLIGLNRDKIPSRRVATQENVARFVNFHFKNLITGVGVNVVDTGGTVIVKAELVKFYADEAQKYDGEVELRLTFTDTSGNVLWSYMINGTSSRYGISYKADNYYEVLSDSMISATRALIENPRFREILAASK
jgi:hypothetical protein